MSIVVMGISHKSTSLDLLERCSVEQTDLAQHLAELTQGEHIDEAVIVSTCNRTEFYAATANDSPDCVTAALDELRSHLDHQSTGHPLSDQRHLYSFQDAQAAGHLFAVAAGIESAVIGESEILGQVKSAWEISRTNTTCATNLNHLFRHSIIAAKRARAETQISRSTASVPHAAVAMATRQIGSLANRKVLIVGAGGMAQAVAVALAGDKSTKKSAGTRDHESGPTEIEILITNRTYENADELAKQVGGRAIALTELEQALTQVDMLLTATGASQIIVEAVHFDDVIAQRAGRPLLIVDIAVPRDVDPSVAQIDGVTLLDMDDLTRFAAAGRQERQDEVILVQQIINAEVKRYSQSAIARSAAPLITAMRSSVEVAADAELKRIFARHPDWDDAHRTAVRVMTKSLVAKFLHKPTMALKDTAGTDEGLQLTDSVRRLFDI